MGGDLSHSEVGIASDDMLADCPIPARGQSFMRKRVCFSPVRRIFTASEAVTWPAIRNKTDVIYRIPA